MHELTHGLLLLQKDRATLADEASEKDTAFYSMIGRLVKRRRWVVSNVLRFL